METEKAHFRQQVAVFRPFLCHQQSNVQFNSVELHTCRVRDLLTLFHIRHSPPWAPSISVPSHTVWPLKRGQYFSKMGHSKLQPIEDHTVVGPHHAVFI